MKPTPLALGPDRLLGEADFVRALARSLLADPAAADDVAQEALGGVWVESEPWR